MKKTLLTAIAALFLAIGAGHAYTHREFHRCGEDLITSASQTTIDKTKFSLLLQQKNGSWKMRTLPNRLFRWPGVDLYYRGLKCSDVSSNELPDGVIDAIFLQPPKFEPPKEPPWTDHIPPPKDCSMSPNDPVCIRAYVKPY
jgi:hypothetical protein